MANNPAAVLPRLTPEQRRAAAGQLERANQVIAIGDLDYGIQLLLTCCRIDPANPVYRQALRQAERTKFGDQHPGGLISSLGSLRTRGRMKNALRRGDYLNVLEFGEQI